MGKNSRAAAATTSKRSTGKKTTNNQTDGLTKQVADKAISNFKLNGLPKPNKKICNLTYKELCELYYSVIKPKIKELCEDYEITIENLCAHDDGGASVEIVENTGISHTANNDSIYLALNKRQIAAICSLVKVEKDISQGKYSNRCERCQEFIPSVRVRFVPEERVCVKCAS